MALGRLSFDPFVCFRDRELLGEGEGSHAQGGAYESHTNGRGDRGVKNGNSPFSPAISLFIDTAEELAFNLQNGYHPNERVGRLRLPTSSGYDDNCS